MSLRVLLSLCWFSALAQPIAAQEGDKGQTSSVEARTVEAVLDAEAARLLNRTVASPAAASTTEWTVLLSDGFEGGTVNPAWQRFANNGRPQAWWGPSGHRAQTGVWSAYATGAGPEAVNAPGPYRPNMVSWMIAGPYDLSGFNEAEVTYGLWLNTERSFDFKRVMASTNGLQFFGSGLSGNSQGWIPQSLDLRNVPGLGNVTGQPQVWVAFLFTSNENTEFEGAYIDDVVFRARFRKPAEMAVSATSMSFAVSGEGAASQTITISNTGQADLRWRAAATVEPPAVPPARAHVREQAEASHVLVAPGYAHGFSAGGSAASDPALASLLAEAQGGAVPVLVELAVPVHAEGHLSAPAAEAQRGLLSRTQQAVLSDVAVLGARKKAAFETVPYLALWADASAIARLAARPDVVRVIKDEPVPPGLLRSAALVGAPAAWAMGADGAGQAVVILDTGVERAHPFFEGRVVSEACFSTTSPSTDPARNSTSLCPGGVPSSLASGSGEDCSGASGCGHGTHVAGIAAGRNANEAGIARAADIISMQVFSRFSQASEICANPPCVLSYSSDQLLALERVATLSTSHRIASVNMSLGGGRHTVNCDANVLKPAIDNLRSLGIATVISAGNNGYTDAFSSPACISSAVSVGAVSSGAGGSVADVVTTFSNSLPLVSLLAPGQGINSATPGGTYAALSGTSMAAPHVAGAWAAVKSRHPGASVDAVLDALHRTGSAVRDERNGVVRPRIQIDAALGAFTWLTTDIGSTILGEGQQVEVRVSVDASGLAPGVHRGRLLIVSNAATGSFLEIPVELTTATVSAEGTLNNGSTVLLSVSPNPVSGGVATIAYTLETPGPVRLAVYDLLGREVAMALQGESMAGESRVALSTEGLAPGVYVVRFVAGDVVQTRRLTVVR